MSNRLIDKIRKSRETQIDVGGMRITIRRPAVSEFPSFLAVISAINRVVDNRDNVQQADIDAVLNFVSDHVVGWDAKEYMLYSGGTGEAAPFSREIFHDWLINSDGDHWWTIYAAIRKTSEVAAEKEGEIVKN